MATAAFTIGHLTIGPSCGKKAGLLQISCKKAGQVRFVGRFRAGKVCQGDTLDLFEEIEE